MRRFLSSALVSLVLISGAHANVILLGEVDLTGQGFGNVEPLLSLQATGGATTESGSLSPLSGPTFGELAWNSASQVQLLFNATEPSGNSINLDKVTLTFQSGGSQLSLWNENPITITDTNPGLGTAGFLLGLDAAQQLTLALFLSSLPNVSDVRLGLSALLSDVGGGPETFSAVSGVPLPPAVLLFLSALIGLGLLARQKVRHVAD